MQLNLEAMMDVEEVLGQPAGNVDVPGDWWSWTGAHGGLVVGVAAHHIEQAARDGQSLRSLSAVLHTPVRKPLAVEVTPVRSGLSVSTWRATATTGDRPAVTATAVYGRPGQGPSYAAAPPPDADAPHNHDVLDLNVDIIPFSQHIEVRPVSDSRPFAGGSAADLTAWVRLVDERPVGPVLVPVLLDALPPSLFATMTSPIPIPTVELAIHYAAIDPLDASPWLLVRTRTTWSEDGWVAEEVLAWTESGSMAARATQLRLCMTRND